MCVRVVAVLAQWCVVAWVCAGVSAGVCAGACAGPPWVVRMTPEHGDRGVAASTTEIRIEFDQEMDQGGRSICGGGERFPELTGAARWESARVLVLPVKLRAGWTYQLSVNCVSAGNTRSVAGEAAEITPLWFSTAKEGETGATGAERGPTREENVQAVRELRGAMDERYAYRDRVVKDWDARFQEFQAVMEGATTRAGFARAAARMLAAAEDPHVSVMLAEDVGFASARRRVSPNATPALLPTLVSGWKDLGEGVYSGRVGDVGYVRIDTWSDAAAERAVRAIVAWRDEQRDRAGLKLVMDVRMNAGGDELAARRVAAMFVERASVYATNRVRDPGFDGDGGNKEAGWSPTYERVLEPAAEQFAGGESARVAVLVGPVCMSSCESFVMMMRQSPVAKLVGARTYGSSGNPRPVVLSNGVRVLLSSWQDMDVDEKMIEGVGLLPDIAVEFDARGEKDAVLERAMEWLGASEEP
jgi:hypothetical protein